MSKFVKIKKLYNKTSLKLENSKRKRIYHMYVSKEIKQIVNKKTNSSLRASFNS